MVGDATWLDSAVHANHCVAAFVQPADVRYPRRVTSLSQTETMKSTIPLIVTLLLSLSAPAAAQQTSDYLSRRIQTLLARTYDHKMISSGQNFPAVNVQREHRGDLIILLREGIPPASIRDHFGWSEAEWTERLDELLQADLVEQTETGAYLPSILVMTLGDVARYMTVPEDMIVETADLVVRNLPEVKRRYAEIAGFHGVAFEAASFLVLSDVLLDNWQINAVEREFLGAERPLRAGSRYYYSIQEKPTGSATEAFGIYGNQYRGYGPVTVGVYGNRRNDNPQNFQTLGEDEIGQLFGVTPESVREFKEELLGRVVDYARGQTAALSEEELHGLDALGWMNGDALAVPILDSASDNALSELAAMMTSDLVALLEAHRSSLTRSYETSPYAQEVTFEEYFIWWYHLYYTAVTDRLAAQGYIVRPESGITAYLFVQE